MFEPSIQLFWGAIVIFLIFLFLSLVHFWYLFLSLMSLGLAIFLLPLGIKKKILRFLQDAKIIKMNYDYQDRAYYNHFPKVLYRFSDNKFELFISGHIPENIDLNKLVREDFGMRLVSVSYDFDYLKLVMVNRPELKEFDWNE